MNDPPSPALLTSGPIGRTLLSLSAPMLAGILSMMGFNVIDAFFVARLGTLQLAALTLTFPVSMIVGTFTIGLGVGAMAAISRCIGQGDSRRIRRYGADAITLSTLCVLLLALIGLATIDPLFRLLGATEQTLPFVRRYMPIWYAGMVFYVVPMVGGNIMRATGDTVTPSVLMVAAMAFNAALDPLFIFGWGPLPPLGIAGAAIASAATRAVTLIAALWILCVKKRLIGRLWPGLPEWIASWKVILGVGLPVAFSNAVIPVALGIITAIVSRFGPEAVAGFGIGGRIESLGFTLIIALSTGISPFVGQNFGAGKIDRIEKGLSYAKIFSLAWGAALLAAFFVLGTGFAACFDHNPSVITAARLYLWIIPASLGLRGIHQITWTALNVLGRPYDALFLELLLSFGLWIPLAVVGGRLAHLPGVFAGLSIANFLGGAVAWVWAGYVVRKEKRRTGTGSMGQ